MGMTSTTCGELVVKQDARGRVRHSKERREALLCEFDRSGMSGASFARLSGIRYTTFAGWIKSRKRKVERERLAVGTGKVRSPIRLLEAMVEPGTHHPGEEVKGLRIELPGGSGMRIESPVQMQMAAELVALITERLRRRC